MHVIIRKYSGRILSSWNQIDLCRSLQNMTQSNNIEVPKMSIKLTFISNELPDKVPKISKVPNIITNKTKICIYFKNFILFKQKCIKEFMDKEFVVLKSINLQLRRYCILQFGFRRVHHHTNIPQL